MTDRWTVRWFRKRALLYHLFVLTLVPGCLWAGWWQVRRAASGNTLSYLYSFEWPIFAILAMVGWWQLIHEDPAAVESRQVERARRAANRGPFVPPPPDADSGFYHPLQPGYAGVLASGHTDDPAPSESGPTGREVFPPALDPGGEPAAVHALSSYNAYLARLSAGGGRKSWRNPRGITPACVRAGASSPMIEPEQAPTAAAPLGSPADIRALTASTRETEPVGTEER